ncbi:unnamed protein product [Rotaria sp. Silwood1]|nr:unnamed protein product [Rotaria sp. Silwood1]CAF1227981.1 unnamed protein product [Rotaria sp. Silwood1]CAF3470608.1 unnamed protein product [Rotaria sp. Silwood1]CAF3487084.1 unnamed protein product [Rotaria sp. Silwood1]CAF3490338.1 unnamed protein product [Rotaria sp. Silwood1]
MTTAIEPINIRPVHSMTCYICLENIITMNKQFGIQNNCDHIFCFDCLSTWRRTSAMIDKDTSRRCPLCRTRSTFIARSWRCFTNRDDKQSLIDTHKLSLKAIPCRTLLRYGFCRFGHRCYYNHHIPLTSSTSQRWSSSPIDMPISFNDHQQNSSIIVQSNTIQSMNENNNDEQQEPPRRFTYNLHRYRPY